MKVLVGCGQLFEIDHARFLAHGTRTRIFATLSGMRRLLLVLAICGCGGGGGDDKPADAAIDAPPLCTHLQDLKVLKGHSTIFGTMNGRFPGTLCIENRSDIGCSMTDFGGNFTMCAPSMGDYGIRLAKEGFSTTVYLHGPNLDYAGWDFSVPDDAFAGPKFWTPINATYPPTTMGNLVLLVRKELGDGTLDLLSGAQIATVPSNGLTVVYFDDMGKPDMALTSTSTLAYAEIANVPPGELDIQINAQGFPNCQHITGGYASPDNSQHARVPVVAGAMTVVAMKCKP